MILGQEDRLRYQDVRVGQWKVKNASPAALADARSALSVAAGMEPDLFLGFLWLLGGVEIDDFNDPVGSFVRRSDPDPLVNPTKYNPNPPIKQFQPIITTDDNGIQRELFEIHGSQMAEPTPTINANERRQLMEKLDAARAEGVRPVQRLVYQPNNQMVADCYIYPRKNISLKANVISRVTFIGPGNVRSNDPYSG